MSNTLRHANHLIPLPEKIGKYHVVGLAGHGNMGTVFVGHDPFTDRDVAIKICAIPTRGDDSSARTARKLFFNEAHTAGVLEHPNILSVLDAGEEAGQPYIVMEYVHGGATLAPHCVPEGLLPVERVAEYVARCAAALDYAHRRGVVHRDIKPSNIMLTPAGEVKIGDFGIAQRTLDDTTHVMGMMGSPRYMSPEQTMERALSGQTDIYSLGVVMYELLTGRPPFTSTNLPVLFKQITTDPVPPLEDVRPGLPPALDSIVQCALEKELPYRYQSGAELAADLAAVFTDLRADTGEGITEERRFDILRELSFFNEFADSELVEVIHAARWTGVTAGHRCELPAREHSYVVVVSGDAEIVGGDRVLATLAPGDAFGAGRGSGETVRLRARNDTTLLVVSPARLERTSDACQLRFNRVLLQGLVQRLSMAAGLVGGSDDGGRDAD